VSPMPQVVYSADEHGPLVISFGELLPQGATGGSGGVGGGGGGGGGGVGIGGSPRANSNGNGSGSGSGVAIDNLSVPSARNGPWRLSVVHDAIPATPAATAATAGTAGTATATTPATAAATATATTPFHEKWLTDGLDPATGQVHAVLNATRKIDVCIQWLPAPSVSMNSIAGAICVTMLVPVLEEGDGGVDAGTGAGTGTGTGAGAVGGAPPRLCFVPCQQFIPFCCFLDQRSSFSLDKYTNFGDTPLGSTRKATVEIYNR